MNVFICASTHDISDNPQKAQYKGDLVLSLIQGH
jgi:hypothetical protein